MATLIIAEHDNSSIKPATLNTVSAAAKLGGDIHVLVAGTGCDGAAKAAAQVAGVTKVIKADNAALPHGIAENIAPIVVALAGAYSHILAPATTFGKNILPRAAALLDVQQISDITGIISADTFERP
ncbi:MAG TPA: electron transfer flavoprotein subunit alpha/FixB family protein, partial [Alphaproteobacteria bacterium]|nr:electron transfer flavoprotein subunit alpha/FixB family protein [Alphaproteobacteria bacterium]